MSYLMMPIILQELYRQEEEYRKEEEYKQQKKLDEYKTLGYEIAEELIGSGFQPKEDKIYLYQFTEYLKAHLDYKEIDVKNEEFYIIRRNFINRFLELINTKTEYKAKAEYKDEYSIYYIKIWK